MAWLESTNVDAGMGEIDRLARLSKQAERQAALIRQSRKSGTNEQEEEIDRLARLRDEADRQVALDEKAKQRV